MISKLPDKQHELILKEYKKMNYETVRLKRRGFIFGKQVASLVENSKYKAIENKAMEQSIFSFRSTLNM
ncbi:hypothetical protein [Clostridium amylolyticum]|uniref:hypothetical protein n=1 Tax=Clostridium amylolyticum TaxID=1121298 RepID=UPI001160BBD0|nr:hypothetical protein [Clostridium amylolyticum]